MEGKTTHQNISFLTDGGEMGELIRAKNWSNHVRKYRVLDGFDKRLAERHCQKGSLAK